MGQPSAQRPQAMHSPDRRSARSGWMRTGQLSWQRLQPRAQLSRRRLKSETGNTGSSENMAPKGQRNWQKKRSTKAIPTMTAPSAAKAVGTMPSSERAVMPAKATQGLAPETWGQIPITQRAQMPTRTAYLTSWSACCTPAGSRCAPLPSRRSVRRSGVASA